MQARWQRRNRVPRLGLPLSIARKELRDGSNDRSRRLRPNHLGLRLSIGRLDLLDVSSLKHKRLQRRLIGRRDPLNGSGR
jgi:hypothetical protein